MSGKVIDFNKRSVGDVPAPKFEMCGSCGMNRPSCESIVSSPARCCSNCTHGTEDNLAVKLATSVERNAVVKYLRAQPDFYSRDLDELVAAIEKGEHVK